MLWLLASLLAFLAVGAPFEPARADPQASAAQTPAPAATTPPTGSLDNPLLARWTGPFGGVPPWDAVTPDRFPAAFEAALAAERAEIAAIAGHAQAPTFDNTIAALQRAGQTRDRLVRLFGVMTSNMSSARYQALDREWQPKLAAASDEITFNDRLFRRIEAVHASLGTSALAGDQQRLTRLVYDSFVRRGAKLDNAGKAQLGQINQALAGLFSEFSAKVLADENTWTVFDRESDLEGLPPSLVAGCRGDQCERHPHESDSTLSGGGGRPTGREAGAA